MREQCLVLSRSDFIELIEQRSQIKMCAARCT